MKNNLNKKQTLIKSIVGGLSLAMLFACQTDPAKVAEVTRQDTLPSEMIRDIRLTQTEKGIQQFLLEGPVLYRYNGEKPYLEFPEGFKVIFYDSLGAVKTEITANYGINREKEKLMEARNNVVVLNRDKNERLNTEHLIWDQKKKRIFSEVFVKITTDDEVIYGEDGMESDEKFENWIVKNPKGEFLIKEKEEL